MRAFLTGATGFVGHHVARLLKARGLPVRALVRGESLAGGLEKMGIEPCEGDLRDAESVSRAMEGCSHVFHVAADYRLWVPDPRSMYETNVSGTVNVMQAAWAHGVERVVYTSTVGTLAPGRKGVPSDEETPVDRRWLTGHYKRSKYAAEKRVLEYTMRGLPAVVVNPSTPIGPADRKPTPTGQIIVDFLRGRMPAYLDTGLNFVDVEDVAEGHWLAALKGRVGQRYILGNRNMSLREFLEALAKVSGRRAPRVRLPYLPVLGAAYVDEAVSRWVTKRAPRIPVMGVKMSHHYMYFDPSKAVRELGLPQRPVEDAIKRAVIWFMEMGYVPEHRASHTRFEGTKVSR
jgi:dihydroflavonol-4-reductase